MKTCWTITPEHCRHFWLPTDDCRYLDLGEGHIGVVFARGGKRLWAFFFEAN